ncbi:MAG: hypothetical protein LBH98_03430 [Chitinispirillales bacterium]|jgi:hypothetical protein|nr:hypothetical protein [Chitinispirillales bacterium]
MKKVLLTLVVISAMAFSNDLAFKQGTNVLNAGLNLYYLNVHQGVRPGLLAAFDHGAINNMFSFGGELGFYTERYNDLEYHSFKTNDGYESSWVKCKKDFVHISPLFRFGFHPFGIPAVENKGFKALSAIDPYVVLTAGVTIKRFAEEWTHPTLSKDKNSGATATFAYGIKPGIRWYFNERVNLWGEGWWEYFAIGAGINF